MRRSFLCLLLLLSLLVSGCTRRTGRAGTQEPPDPGDFTAPPTLPEPEPEPKPEPEPVPVLSVDELFPPYRQSGILLAAVAGFPVGSEIEIRSAENGVSFSIVKDGATASAPWNAVLPTTPVAPTLPPVTDADISRAAGELAPESETPFLLWTDLWRLRTYALSRISGGVWQVIGAFPCAVGDISHPTPRGTYRVNYHEMFLGKEDRYLCKYTLAIGGDYLYHSILLDWQGRETVDDRLSDRVSLGCIRHSLDDSRYLYELIPDGTAVLIR